MFIDITNLVKPNQTIAVALSGGSDSMALLHYMQSATKKFPFNVVAINVEHGIRGQESKLDTAFVKDFCDKNNIPILTYEVESIKYAEQQKLSLEQSARILRYNCFFDAINKGFCDKVATAHHADDNAESVLLNLFRGTSTKGVAGIKEQYLDKIIRPFLSVDKREIESYVKENKIPFVTDKTNFCDDYTRNFLRLNVIPKIKEVFPEATKSILRFSTLSREEDEFLDDIAKNKIITEKSSIKIPLTLHKVVLSRAVIIALKELGLEKDYEKVHVDSVLSLTQMENGSKINLPKDIIAIKEYDNVVLYKQNPSPTSTIPFSTGRTLFGEREIVIEKVCLPVDLKDGLYADLDKIPKSAVIRTKKEGDLFTKFGGGTKSLGDYLTDKKIPLRLRESIPLLADGNKILCVFGIAVSDQIKVDQKTNTIIKLYID